MASCIARGAVRAPDSDSVPEPDSASARAGERVDVSGLVRLIAARGRQRARRRCDTSGAAPGHGARPSLRVRSLPGQRTLNLVESEGRWFAMHAPLSCVDHRADITHLSFSLSSHGIERFRSAPDPRWIDPHPRVRRSTLRDNLTAGSGPPAQLPSASSYLPLGLRCASSRADGGDEVTAARE